MKLPISFEEVAYYKNEFRGDLIVTKGVLYYFPHTRVKYQRYADELGGKDGMVIFEVLGNLAPIFAAVPWLRVAADEVHLEPASTSLRSLSRRTNRQAKLPQKNSRHGAAGGDG